MIEIQMTTIFGNTNLHIDELSKPCNNILTIFFSYRFKVCSFTATRHINHVSLATLVVVITLEFSHAISCLIRMF